MRCHHHLIPQDEIVEIGIVYGHGNLSESDKAGEWKSLYLEGFFDLTRKAQEEYLRECRENNQP